MKVSCLVFFLFDVVTLHYIEFGWLDFVCVQRPTIRLMSRVSGTESVPTRTHSGHRATQSEICLTAGSVALHCRMLQKYALNVYSSRKKETNREREQQQCTSEKFQRAPFELKCEMRLSVALQLQLKLTEFMSCEKRVLQTHSGNA